MRILIASICYSSVSPEADRALRYAERYLQDMGHEVAREWFVGDCVLLRARSHSIQLALEYQFPDGKPFDYLIWVDADIIVGEDHLFRLISHKKDIVAAPYRKKCDQQIYAIQPIPGQFVNPDKSGLAKVWGAGTGCMALSRRVLKDIYDNGHKYYDAYGIKRSFSLRYGFEKDDFITADFQLCHDLINRGWEIYLDSLITPSHQGTTFFSGDFRDFIIQQNQTILSDKIPKTEMFGLDFIITGPNRFLLWQLSDLLNALDIPCGKEGIFNLSFEADSELRGDSSVFAYPFLENFNGLIFYLKDSPLFFINTLLSLPNFSIGDLEKEFYTCFGSKLQFKINNLSPGEIQDNLPLIESYAAERWMAAHQKIAPISSLKIPYEELAEGNISYIKALLSLLGEYRDDDEIIEALSVKIVPEIYNSFDLSFEDLSPYSQRLLGF